MDVLLALLAGLLFAVGTYLMLRPHLVRFVFGLLVLGNGVNLLILTAGRVRGAPPLVPERAEALAGPFANPLPQALVLTAVVIAFGLVAYTLALLLRVSREAGTLDPDAMEPGPPVPPASTPRPRDRFPR